MISPQSYFRVDFLTVKLLIRPTCLLLVVSALAFASADQTHAQKVDVGLRAGMTYTGFKGDTGATGGAGTSDYGRVFGGRVGGMLSVPVTEAFLVRGEVTYFQKGATLELTRQGRTQAGSRVELESDLTFSYDYLDVPVLAVYKFRAESRLRPHVFAGPSVAFNLGSSLDAETTGRVFDQFGNVREIDPDQLDEPESPDLESTEVGAVIGGGVSYRLDSGDSLLLDVRYNPSLTAFNSERGGPDEDVTLENEAITVGIGYRFSL